MGADQRVGAIFRALYGLSATSISLLVATPVLLGSLARIPVGMLADRPGGRIVFPAVMLLSAAAAAAIPFTTSYASLLAVAFLLGLAGSSFAVGAGFVSRWAPAARQGSALGGQSLVVFGGPVLAAYVGWRSVFNTTAGVLVVWAFAFWVLARDAPVTVRPKSRGEMLHVLVATRTPALLSLFYFLTFGGFVAFSIYLPTLLKDRSA